MKSPKTELKVFNELLETVLTCSSDNEAHITNVKAWADSWRKEMNLAINHTRCSKELCDCKYPNIRTGANQDLEYCGLCMKDLDSTIT